MIILNRNQPTKAAFTLYEKCKDSIDKKFFFVLKNKETKKEYYITGNDVSPSKKVYNLFVFTNYESETCGEYASGTNGYYTAPEGEYIYKVYQSNNPEYYDLNGSVLCETGILMIQSERVKLNTIDDGDNYHIPVLNESDIVVIKNNC